MAGELPFSQPGQKKVGGTDIADAFLSAGGAFLDPTPFNPIFDEPGSKGGSVYAHTDIHTHFDTPRDSTHTDEKSLTIPPQHTDSHLDIPHNDQNNHQDDP